MSKEEPGIPMHVFGLPGRVISQVLDKQMDLGLKSWSQVLLLLYTTSAIDLDPTQSLHRMLRGTMRESADKVGEKNEGGRP